MAELVGNASQERLNIPEGAGRQVNSLSLQAGEGKLGFVCVKGVAYSEETLMLQNDNGHTFIGVRSVAKIGG
jgi:hypothetical protein